MLHPRCAAAGGALIHKSQIRQRARLAGADGLGEFVDGCDDGVGSCGDKSTKVNAVQTIDEDSGLPVWTVDVMDGDPEVRKADRTFTVTLLSKLQPVLPAGIPGLPITPIELEGLTASPWVDTRGCSAPDEGRSHRCRARQGWSFRAIGVKAPKNRPAVNKPAA
jgi:hypothetical protein